MIQEIPPVGTTDYNERCEEVLAKLAACKSDEEDLFRICDQFFKKIPSFADWKKLKYENPLQAFRNLQIIAERIRKPLLEKDSAQHYLMFLFATYGADQAYRSLKDVPQLKETSPFFSQDLCEKVNELQCSDSFWTARVKELYDSRPKKKSEYVFPVVSMNPHEKQFLTLSDEMQTSIWEWWGSDANKDLRAKVEASIITDRKEQEKRITDEIQKAKDTKRELEEKQKKIEKEISDLTKLVETHAKEIPRLEEKQKKSKKR